MYNVTSPPNLWTQLKNRKGKRWHVDRVGPSPSTHKWIHSNFTRRVESKRASLVNEWKAQYNHSNVSLTPARLAQRECVCVCAHVCVCVRVCVRACVGDGVEKTTMHDQITKQPERLASRLLLMHNPIPQSLPAPVQNDNPMTGPQWGASSFTAWWWHSVWLCVQWNNVKDVFWMDKQIIWRVLSEGFLITTAGVRTLSCACCRWEKQQRFC